MIVNSNFEHHFSNMLTIVSFLESTCKLVPLMCNFFAMNSSFLPRSIFVMMPFLGCSFGMLLLIPAAAVIQMISIIQIFSKQHISLTQVTNKLIINNLTNKKNEHSIIMHFTSLTFLIFNFVDSKFVHYVWYFILWMFGNFCAVPC